MFLKFLLIISFNIKLLIFISVSKTYTKELMGEPIGSMAPMTDRDPFSLTLYQSIATLHIFTFR